jgi:uncharacterized caspase-like protein
MESNMITRNLIKITALILTLAITFGGANGAQAEKRVALVVGNSAYQFTSVLANPSNDARAIAAKLEELNFIVIEGFDLDYRGLNLAMREFAIEAKDADLNLFFYAGHGVDINGTNYIVPTDARFADESAPEFEAVPVDRLIRLMQFSAGVSLVFLDACRDNPLGRTLARSMGGGTRSAGVRSGLAEMQIQDPGEGIAIGFATSPGHVALDGEGDNSPFTTALLKFIDAPNMDITEVMSRVTGDVYKSTKQSQRPWLNTSLTGLVILNPVAEPLVAAAPAAAPTTTVAAAPTVNQDLETEKFMLQMARESGDIADYEAYLESFPRGKFAALATNAIKRLEEDEAEIVTAAIAPETPTITRAISIEPTGPLLLQVTPAVATAHSSQLTEEALFMKRAKRKEVQARLNLTGADTGRPDGAFGRKTRIGIQNWQLQSGLLATGFLNAVQLQILTANTEVQYVAYLSAQPAPQPVVAKKVAPKKAAEPSSAQSEEVSSPGEAVDKIITGIGTGLGKLFTSD